jgi:hypothetical protein
MGVGTYCAVGQQYDLAGINVFFRHFDTDVIFLLNRASLTIVLASEW